MCKNGVNKFVEKKDHSAGMCARTKKNKSYPKLQQNVLWCPKKEEKEYSFPSEYIKKTNYRKYKKITINEPIQRKYFRCA